MSSPAQKFRGGSLLSSLKEGKPWTFGILSEPYRSDHPFINKDGSVVDVAWKIFWSHSGMQRPYSSTTIERQLVNGCWRVEVF